MTAAVAGRELDALVAEKVMGWRRLNYLPTYRQPPIVPPDHIPGLRADLPEYSTDVAASWTIVDHLTKYPQSNIVAVCQPHDGNPASCRIVLGGAADLSHGELLDHLSYFGKGVTAHSKTVPLAICLAALKLKGVDV